MKKIISILLMLALCLGLFAGCSQPAGPTTPATSDLDNAKTYLFKMYNTAGKDEENKLMADKDLTAVVMIGGVPYKVEWTVNITAGPADSVKIVEAENANHIKVDIMDEPEEEMHYILTATVRDEAGNSASMSLKCYTPAVEPAGTANAIKVTAPEAGVPYRLGMLQGNVGKTLYFAGTVANKDYYLATTEDLSAATDVTLEEVQGGYKLYFMAEGTKTYLDVYKSGDYVNLRLTTEPTAVWTWNTEYNTLVADVEGTTYYCGTYKEYTTLSASDIKHASTSFPANLFAAG